MKKKFLTIFRFTKQFINIVTKYNERYYSYETVLL